MAQYFGKDIIGALAVFSTTVVTLQASTILIGGAARKSSSQLQINLSVGGVGGLDTGSVAANTTYYIHAVKSGTGLAIVASLSSSLPTGFTKSKVIGRIRTAVSSSSILFAELAEGFDQNGNLIWPTRQYDLSSVVAVYNNTYAVNHAVGVYHQFPDGKHRITFNVSLQSASAFSTGILIIGGISLKMGSGAFHAISVNTEDVGSYTGGEGRANGGNMFDVWCGNAHTKWHISGDVELHTKPDWAA